MGEFADNGESVPGGGQQGNQGDPSGSGLSGGGGYAQQHYAQNKQLQEQLQKFWAEMRDDVEKVGTDPAEFKSQQLPLARIKKIMKSDEDVRMISAEAPVLFAKACEFFILEMTLRGWNAAEEHKRRTLQRGDIATAIARTEVWDFLLDTVPPQEGDAQAAGNGTGAGAAQGTSADPPPPAAPAAPPAPVAAPNPPPPAAAQMPPMGMFQGQFMAQMNPGMPQMGQVPGLMQPGGPGMPLPPGAMLYPGMFLPQAGQPGAGGQFPQMPGMGMQQGPPGAHQQGEGGSRDDVK